MVNTGVFLNAWWVVAANQILPAYSAMMKVFLVYTGWFWYFDVFLVCYRLVFVLKSIKMLQVVKITNTQ